MRISINCNVPGHSGPATIRDELVRVLDAAEEVGLDTVWTGDHLIEADPNRALEGEVLEPYTLLGFAAARTERVRLGTMVTAVTYRPPALLIKAVTTLDVLSGGRAWLGVGAGYHRTEAEMMGLPMPPDAERAERLAETLRIAMRMWSGDDGPFDGVHYRLGRPLANPAPLTRPHPPILIGGTGEKRILPLVAHYADACNLFDIPDGGRTLRRKLAVLAELCANAGRPYSAIEKTVSTRLEEDETADAFARRCDALADLGIDHVVAIQTRPWTPPDVARLGAAVRLGAG